MDREDRERLGRLVKQRAAELRLHSVSDITRATSISAPTVTKVLAGEPVKRVDRLRVLSEGLGWTADSAERILEGGEPRDFLVALEDERTRIVQELNDLHMVGSDREDVMPHIQASSRELEDVTRRISEERTRREAAGAQRQPAIGGTARIVTGTGGTAVGGATAAAEGIVIPGEIVPEYRLGRRVLALSPLRQAQLLEELEHLETLDKEQLRDYLAEQAQERARDLRHGAIERTAEDEDEDLPLAALPAPDELQAQIDDADE